MSAAIIATEVEGCPDGMYPLDFTYEPEECEDFAELREQAEAASNILNVPLSWHFDPEDEGGAFSLAFAMPRKELRTWGLTTKRYDRAEVEAWLAVWTKAEMAEWFGWEVSA